MGRLKIAILFGTKPNFDKYAFKYFILYVNKIQKTYEFNFPDVTEYPFDKNNDDVEFQSSLKIVKFFIKQKNLNADHFITLITNSFDNHFFFNAGRDSSIISTDIWDKHFSPPSLFEYLLHCIYTCLIKSQIVVDNNKLSNEQLFSSHEDTRGCIADFTRKKYDDRIDITLGYICDDHTIEIEQFYGKDFLNEVQFIIDRKWIGSIEKKGSVAYNLKHIFKFNINKDSGFNKNFWDKIKDKFYEIPGSLTVDIIKIVLTAIITYYLIKWGIISTNN